VGEEESQKARWGVGGCAKLGGIRWDVHHSNVQQEEKPEGGYEMNWQKEGEECS